VNTRIIENEHGPERESAPAKVNLFLHVIGKRADGYHLLDSLVVFAGIADRITFVPSDTLTLAVIGPFAASLSAGPDNLVVRAAHVLAAESGIPPTGALTLEKHIPVASGIGGGSADAAAALRLLQRAWRLNPDESTMDRIAAGLGADVPVCLRNQPLRMRGIGEKLTPSPGLPPCGLLLVNPGEPLSTASVFRARDQGFSEEVTLPDGWCDPGSMAAALAEWGNDLEVPAIALLPAIQEVARAIRGTAGCLLTRMSGSGATCFGLFTTAAEAKTAAASLARPGWWTWGGSLAA
jgi:4-diphosphocytidyl-2-C-methyl-D-erythritol kinase